MTPEKAMRYKKLYLVMSPLQRVQLKRFLAENKIMCDGKKEFYLLAQPLMNTQEIEVILLSPKNGDKIYKYFDRIGLKRKGRA